MEPVTFTVHTLVLCFSINLMKQLISSSNLFVMQVEMDVYTALKKVLTENPSNMK